MGVGATVGVGVAVGAGVGVGVGTMTMVGVGLGIEVGVGKTPGVAVGEGGGGVGVSVGLRPAQEVSSNNARHRPPSHTPRGRPYPCLLRRPWPVARFELEAGRQPRGPATNVFHSLSGADNPPLPRGPISLPPPVVDHFVPLLLVKTIQRRYFRSHWNSIGARRLNSRENVGTSLANMKYLVVENHT